MLTLTFEVILLQYTFKICTIFPFLAHCKTFLKIEMDFEKKKNYHEIEMQVFFVFVFVFFFNLFVKSSYISNFIGRMKLNEMYKRQMQVQIFDLYFLCEIDIVLIQPLRLFTYSRKIIYNK